MNEIDLFRRHAVDLLEELDAASAHGDQPVGKRRHLFEHQPLFGQRVLQDGVQCCDDRHAQFAQQRQDMAAGRAAIDAVFML